MNIHWNYQALLKLSMSLLVADSITLCYAVDQHITDLFVATLVDLITLAIACYWFALKIEQMNER